MTNQEILTKAMRQATDKGFRWLNFFMAGGTIHYKGTIDEVAKQLIANKTWPVLVYDRDFAKTLWGEKKRPGVIGLPWKVGEQWIKGERPKTFEVTVHQEYVPNWMYHLQQLVVADDPIKYLGEHLPK